ncbi:MAG TPA: S53 family peptidase [Rhizomicrobium sp.]|nr:S53 family peptidase [Rhizomicrobium sp.]
MLTKSLSAFALTAALSAALCGSASATALLSAHLPAPVANHTAALAGHVDPSTAMRMQVVLPMRNKGELGELARAVSDPSNPQYRHYLSVSEFTRRFGPTKHDYDAAMLFFKSNGLQVTNTFANRYMFQVEGKAADVERVLHVKLNLYKHPTQDRNFMSPDREPTLDLKVPVQEVTNLKTYVLPYPKLVHSDARDGRGATGSGPSGNYIASDFRAVYYATGKKAKLDGKGQSVGLMELGAFNPADVSLYFTNFGPTNSVAVNGIGVGGAHATCSSCEDGEQELDIVYAIGMAPGLDQVQVYVSGDPVAIENQMVSDNTSKQLSTSWGYDEDFATEDALYQEMAVQGQSWFTASGDNSTLNASGPWPEEDANIIAVGGTDLVTSGPGGTWVSEPGWEDSASGPSTDHTILIEDYQLPYINKKNMGSKTLRNVSDISANGDFDMMICDRGKCAGGWGGTSFSSPIWAGFNALMNQYALKKGKPTVGFLNPTVYALAKGDKKMLHDVIGNKSGVYPAVKGYDLVGGLGSPNGMKTIRAIVGK